MVVTKNGSPRTWVHYVRIERVELRCELHVDFFWTEHDLVVYGCSSSVIIRKMGVLYRIINTHFI